MEESNTSNILYDLLTYSEWTQDPDKIPDKQICQSSASHGTFGLFRKSVSLVDEINRVSNWQLPCKFAAGELGKVVAILLETTLEIRTSRDEYITVVGKATVAKDPMPQWRRMAWSPDSTILAVSFSNGTIHFYDLLGSNLFNIPSMNDGEDSKSNSLESALACMMFIPSRTKTKWSTELLVINYAGNLQSYFVSPTDGFLENHAFTFSKDGIASAAWHPTHNLIYVSSLPDQIFSTSKENGLCYGLTAWRLLNDYPYYKLAVPPEEELEKAKSRVGLWNMLPSIRSTPQTSIVFRMQISLQGKYLACLHTCGSVSIWSLPGLSLSGIWKLEEQPNCRERNIEDEKTNKEFDWDKVYPIDINWWPDEKLIIARRNGAISVCELSGLRNILGDKPESLAGATMLSTTCTEKGFLALESDFKIIKKRHQQSTDQLEEISDKEEEQKEDEEEEEEKDSLFTRGSALVQSTIYYITDSERFRPERKLPKLIQRTYRLIALKSTTPEELFSRKIDNEEYTQALALAHTYNLDCDRVYQRQWRNSPVSVASIHDYLSKISKCSWVLQECCERVPETLSAAKELLEFGLKMTENQLGEIFKQHWIAKNESVEDSIDDDLSEKFDFIEFVKETNLETLSEEEKRTISARIKLLKFSDRLHTYQLILKNAMEAASTNTASSSIEPSTDENNDDVDNDYENFDKEFYDRFRHQSIVVSAVYYAQKGDYSAVKVLFTYHGSETLNYWLSILENFPETLLPSKYSELLPECSCDGDVFEWNVMKIRDTDWCEVDKFNSLSIEEEEKWDNCPSLDSHSSLTAAELSVWYRKRIHQIESSSHLVDPALDLMSLARKLNIKGLDDLYHQLLTLDMLVYELGMEDLTLEELEKLSPLEKALLLVKDANEENFVENLLHRVVPYVDRHEGLVPNSRKPLLSHLFSNLSSQSLTLPLKLFQYLRDEPANRIASTLEERISLTLDCLYTNSATDEIGKAFLILSCLPDRSTIQGSTDLEDFRKRLEVVESELKTAVILKRHGQPKPLLYIHNNAHDLQTVQNLVLRISRATANKVPPASETEWNQLFTDILELQKNTFSCMSLELCYELYASTVMASGDLKIIRSAMKILCCCAGDQHRKQISFDRSVDLVLQAAREYFDSASSLYDPGMQNAKACLNLIIEENPQIQEELDLIWSLQLLSDFNVNLLPMQVRLCPNRMRLIENCLQSQPTAYRNHQKLLVLADKLRICSSSEHERKGSVLVRVAEAAFSAKDYSYCCTICNMLVNDEHAVGWEICQKLGQCSEFTQIGARQHLISFALLHCSPQHLQDLIKTRCDLEIESTQQEISKSLSNMEIFSSLDQDDEFVDALTSPTTPMKEFLPQWTSKLQSTTNLLSKMTSSNFWKNSFNLGTSEAASKPTLLDNSDFKKQGFPSFYSPLHPGCHRSALTPSFLEDEDNIIKSSQRMKQLTLVQKLLQSVLLEQETQSPSSQNSINNVLIQASQLIMSEDCQLGLGYLFSLSNISVAEQCFSNLPQTQVSLQLALYLYSIKQIIHEHKDAFSMLPEDVVNAALNGTKHNEDVHGLIQKYKLKLENFVQTEKMKELNCGVNLDRFTKDTQYKYDSILGLAICQEWDKVELALELGALYGVSGLEVALNHVVAMLLTGDPQLAIEHISDNRLASLLQEDSQLVIKRLEESVFSNLNGTNHQLMIAYYTVLQSVAEKPLIDGILPKDHIKLLKKVKATSSAIDYRSLLRSNLLTALRPALNRDSAANIVKLFKALPTHLRGDVTTSQLYTDMMISDFFYNCLGYSSENKSVSHFELLKSFWTKVSADDLLNFVKSCVFSRKCAEQLDPDMRKQLLSDVIAFCQLQQNIETHGTTQNTLENWLVNLSNTWDSIQFSSVDDSLKNLLCELDVSCGDEESIPSIVESAIMNRSVPFEIIEKKLLSKGLVSISEMITKLLKLVDVKDVESMSVLLDRINSCLDRDLRDEEWPSLVQELASNSQLPPKLRVLAASLMQKVGETGTKEKLLMITIAVLGHPVDSEDIVDENARYSLFTQLLKEKKTPDELMVMQQLLCCWPPFSDAIAEIHPHLQLIEKMILLEYDNVHEYISKVFVENKVDETSVEKIVNRLASLGGHSAIIWLCLITESPNLHSTAIRLLSDFQGDLIPEQIVKRTVELQLTSKLVQSKIYSVWVESLLVLEDGTVARSAIGQLKEAGYLPEAGHLWFSVESIPRPLRTFSASLISLAQRLTKN